MVDGGGRGEGRWHTPTTLNLNIYLFISQVSGQSSNLHQQNIYDYYFL